jgi:hypothetical protein
MTLALLVVYVALLLIYAGVKGKSVQKLLVGDNSAASSNPSVAS